MNNSISFPWTDEQATQIQTALKAGKTLAFPTETFYGLGGNCFLEPLVDRIFEIKERPRHKPLLILAMPQQLSGLILPPTPAIQKLMDHFWPGPLTLIFQAHPDVPDFLLGPDRTLAIRDSGHPVVHALNELSDAPIIGTSANLSNAPEVDTAQGVHDQLGDRVDLIIDGGTSPGGQVSTIINVSTTSFQILRPGAIPADDLAPFL